MGLIVCTTNTDLKVCTYKPRYWYVAQKKLKFMRCHASGTSYARDAPLPSLKTGRDSSTLRKTTDWCGWRGCLEMLPLESAVTRRAANCSDRCCNRHKARCPDGASTSSTHR